MYVQLDQADLRYAVLMCSLRGMLAAALCQAMHQAARSIRPARQQIAIDQGRPPVYRPTRAMQVKLRGTNVAPYLSSEQSLDSGCFS